METIEVERKDETIADRDAEIEALCGQVAEKDMLLSVFDGTLQAAKSRIAELEALVAHYKRDADREWRKNNPESMGS